MIHKPKKPDPRGNESLCDSSAHSAHPDQENSRPPQYRLNIPGAATWLLVKPAKERDTSSVTFTISIGYFSRDGCRAVFQNTCIKQLLHYCSYFSTGCVHEL